MLPDDAAHAACVEAWLQAIEEGVLPALFGQALRALWRRALRHEPETGQQRALVRRVPPELGFRRLYLDGAQERVPVTAQRVPRCFYFRGLTETLNQLERSRAIAPWPRMK